MADFDGGGFFDRVSSFLGNPQFQLGMMKLGGAIAPPRIVGGRVIPSTAQKISDAFSPMVEGGIANEGITGAATATGQSVQGAPPNPVPSAPEADQSGIIQGPNPVPRVDQSGIIRGAPGGIVPTPQESKASDILGGEIGGVKLSALASPHVTGLTYKTPEGASTTVKSPGPQDYVESEIIRQQQQAGEVGQPKFSSYAGSQSPFVPSSASAGGLSTTNLPAMIQVAANKYGIPPNLLNAIVQHESTYDPSAVSPKGAIGLGQVMPATGRDMGYTPEQLRDPATNLEASAKYIRYLADNGINLNDPASIAAAYNGGLRGMQNADQAFVQKVAATAGGQPGTFAGEYANRPQVSTSLGGGSVGPYVPPATPPPSYTPPDFSRMPNLWGLSPEQVDKVYKTGAELARVPATARLEEASGRLHTAQARNLEAEYPMHITRMYNIPGTDISIPANGKEILGFEQNLNQLRSMMEYRRSIEARNYSQEAFWGMKVREQQRMKALEGQLSDWAKKNNIMVNDESGNPLPLYLLLQDPKFRERWVTGMMRAKGQAGKAEERFSGQLARDVNNQIRSLATKYGHSGILVYDAQGNVTLNAGGTGLENRINDEIKAGKPGAKEDLAEFNRLRQIQKELTEAGYNRVQSRLGGGAPQGGFEAPSPAPTQVPTQTQVPPGVPPGAIKTQGFNPKYPNHDVWMDGSTVPPTPYYVPRIR